MSRRMKKYLHKLSVSSLNRYHRSNLSTENMINKNVLNKIGILNNGTTYFTRNNMNRVNVRDRENKELFPVYNIL